MWARISQLLIQTEKRGEALSHTCSPVAQECRIPKNGAKCLLQAVISFQQNTSCHTTFQLEEEMAA